MKNYKDIFCIGVWIARLEPMTPLDALSFYSWHAIILSIRHAHTTSHPKG